MIIDDLRSADFSDIGSAPGSVRYLILSVALILILVAGYFLFIDDKKIELEQSRQQELALMADFEFKQQKAANLEAYEQQLADMEELLETMFRQLPNKTEMDKLLVDISQTALAAGIDVQLFEPQAEAFQDFYAERPIAIRMLGDYHEFGDFVGGVAALPRVVILTMHDISLKRAAANQSRYGDSEGRLILEGRVKTYRYVDEEEVAQRAAEAAP
ncbi:MAG: type 4a pilus biogenesis protein PilO [Xanthomonadales bacterium]|nr:type 4a pilus biogenesis protein PilO [Gammaproteobacteria bacterium]MBT8072251.1 type 4a pilus biogenesis protein PilO [Gammaproteobacteria bacterium]MBT8076864.1 type 4a pilus biogenesis protein PilO [Gammaproteobacteria bacterium]NNK03091.1 type 4a pilus biogenesis protein PilO [Xanthomonadales bacterium]NNL00167.1 type 4a pilus biogenesis protein PilO [Xanthomonadales bacterium]